MAAFAFVSVLFLADAELTILPLPAAAFRFAAVRFSGAASTTARFEDSFAIMLRCDVERRSLIGVSTPPTAAIVRRHMFPPPHAPPMRGTLFSVWRFFRESRRDQVEN